MPCSTGVCVYRCSSIARVSSVDSSGAIMGKRRAAEADTEPSKKPRKQASSGVPPAAGPLPVHVTDPPLVHRKKHRRQHQQPQQQPPQQLSGSAQQVQTSPRPGSAQEGSQDQSSSDSDQQSPAGSPPPPPGNSSSSSQQAAASKLRRSGGRKASRAAAAAAAAVAASGHAPRKSRFRHVYRTATKDIVLWKVVLVVPSALRRTTEYPRLLIIGSSYQTQEAAARAADLGRLALMGPQPRGKPYNFPLTSYTPDQQRQRTGAELARYLQELKQQRGSAVEAAEQALQAAAGQLTVGGADADQDGDAAEAAAAAAAGSDAEAGQEPSETAALGKAAAAVANAQGLLERRKGRLQRAPPTAQDFACGACAACLTGQPCSVAAACIPDKAATAAARAAGRALDIMRLRAEAALQGDFWQFAAVQDPSSLLAVQPLQPLAPLPPPQQPGADGWEAAGEPDPPLTAAAARQVAAAPPPATPAGAGAQGHKVLALCGAAQALGLPHVPYEEGWDLGVVCHSCGALGRHPEGRCPAYAAVRQLPSAAAAAGAYLASQQQEQQHDVASSSAAAAGRVAPQQQQGQQQQLQPGQQGAELEQEQRCGDLAAALRHAADTFLQLDHARASSRLDTSLSRLSRGQQRRQQQQQAAADTTTSGSEASDSDTSSRRQRRRRRQQAGALRRREQAGAGRRREQEASVAKALQMEGSTFVAIAVLLEEMARWRAEAASAAMAAGASAAAAPGPSAPATTS